MSWAGSRSGWPRRPHGCGSAATTLSLSTWHARRFDESAIRDAALIATYLPMHTATRLAAQLIPSLRELNSRAHLCCYGLYAPMNVGYLRSLGVSTILGGEFEEALVHLAERLATGGEQKLARQAESLISLARLSFEVPDRSGMPAIEKYAASDRPRRWLSHRGFDGGQPGLQTSLPSLSDRAGL